MRKKTIGIAIFSCIFFCGRTAVGYGTYRQDNVSANAVANNVTLWLGQAEPLKSGGAEIWMSAHPWLTLRVIQFFEQQYGKSLSEAQKVQIVWGSIAEDIDLQGSGAEDYGDVAPNLLLLGPVTEEWSPNINRAENHFYNSPGDEDGLTCGFGVNPQRNVSSWRWAEGSDLNHFDFWDGVRYGHTVAGWRALGQVLHLLGDASVPAHVRNDAHTFNSDNYENWTKESPSKLTGMFGEQTIEPVRMIVSLRNYFDFVANFSRSNFYSDDSFFQNNSCGYDFCLATECVQMPLVTIGREEWYYFYNTLNRKIGYKGFLFHFLESRGKRAEALVLAVSVNEVVTTDIWQAVTPNVIAAGAGLMKYFFDQLPEIKECVDLDNDGFGRDCPAGNDCDDSKSEINPQIAELCDGIDNNCDYKIDEDCPCQVGTRRSCGPDKGICKPGSQTCESTGWGECRGGVQPQQETCNGLDDDCDGEVDNQVGGNLTNTCQTICGPGTATCERGAWVSCTAPKPTTEVCDGKDNNCDGNIDEGLTRQCSSICGRGVETCINGQWRNCSAPLPKEEVCNGVDDNCDGKIDEVCSCRVGDRRDCGFNIGICRKGRQTCTENGWGECIGEIKPAEEICNNLDDDCDGAVDEGVKNACGKCGALPVEICDGRDNDCDGEIDERVLNACGKCGATPTEVCDGKDNNCDGQIDEGLLNACGLCGPLPTEVCDGKDNNCDGKIDEGFDADEDGFTVCGGDCDENASNINPGVPEICDGIDNNCNQFIDETCVCQVGQQQNCGIAKGICRLGYQECGPDGWSECFEAIWPEEESCNNLDDDCDGAVDEGENLLGCQVFYFDADVDGYGISQSKCLCSADKFYQAVIDGDCNDNDAAIHPGANEVCDGQDNDCDGMADGLILVCYTGPAGTINKGICRSGTQTCGHGQWGSCENEQTPIEEICDEQDNNCDGETDEELIRFCNTECGEGREICLTGQWANCTAPQPSEEICDQQDNDCDGEIDEGFDVDKDGFTNCGGDCDDYNSDIHPKALEFCDRKDNNCNGDIDEFCDCVDGETQECGEGDIGVCRKGWAICKNGVWGECIGAIWPTDEICDSQDNDCDGEMDEELLCGVESTGAMFRNNLQRTGVYDTRENQQGDKWSLFLTEGRIWSSPVIVDGIVYIGSRDEYLYAVDSATRELKWKFRTGLAVDSSPAIVDGIVYFGSYDYNFYAVDSKTGQKKWSFATANGVRSSPVVADGIVYFGSDDENLYAVNIKTGQEKWKFKTNYMIDSSPAIADKKVYFGSWDKHLYAVDSNTGQEKWKFKTGGWVRSTPAVVDGIVYFGSLDKNFYAVDSETGQEKWKFQTGDEVHSSPAITDGVVYFGSRDKFLYALDAQTGQEKWKFQTGSGVDSSPSIAGRIVYFGSYDDYLYAVDSETGQEQRKFKTGNGVYSSPAIVNGVVYFGSLDTVLYAIR